MPTSKRRKKPGNAPRRPAARRPRGVAPADTPSIDGLARTVVRAGRELLEVDDPLDAEHWASQVLGMFYKVPVPLAAREELERSLGPSIVRQAERAGDVKALAVLRAMAAVADDATASSAARAADRLA